MNSGHAIQARDSSSLAYLGFGLQINHFSPGASDSMVALAPDTAPPVPGDRSTNFGRDIDLANLLAELRSQKSRGLWLEGGSGVGKSELAKQLASDLQAEGVRAWWLHAGDEHSVTAALSSIAHQAGATDSDFRRMSPADVLWNALEHLDFEWIIIIDDWLVFDDPRWLQPDRVRWIRSPGNLGRIVVTSQLETPKVFASWMTTMHLSPIADNAGADLLLSLAPDAGTSVEALSLARSLRQNATALVGAGTFLREMGELPKLGDDHIPRTFAAYELALDATDGKHDEAFAYTTVLERSLDALVANGFSVVKPLASIIAQLSTEPVPVSILQHATCHPALADATSTTLARGLSRLAAFKIVDRRSMVNTDSVDMHAIHRMARRRAQRKEGSLTVDLSATIEMLEHWTRAHPAHSPSEWHVWQATSPHLRAVGEGVEGVHINSDLATRILNLRRQAAEFHYLAGQYEIAEMIVRDVLGRIANDSAVSAETIVATKTLMARVRREQGDAGGARVLLEEARTTAAQILERNHPRVLDIELSFARTIREQGDIHGALDRLSELTDVDSPFPLDNGKFDSQFIDWAVRLNVARCHRDLGEAARAVELTERLYASWDQWCVRDSLHYIDMRYEFAENLRQAGRVGEATALHIENLDDARRMLGETHLNVLILQAGILDANCLGLTAAKLRAEREGLYGMIVARFGDDHPLGASVRRSLEES